ncbi:MAG: Gfo/Idh/MocA family oxidoreductase [Ignavibacteria bacterium]|nr:Gfo/Idh/MocA family oxidoreductase [Ignavibacteria bacterium]
MKKEIKVGIVGVGHLGEMHLKNILEITKEKKYIKLSGVYDINKDREKEISRKYKIRTFSTIEDLSEETNTVLISTPTNTHFEIAKYFIEKSKNIFIEKPITSTLEEAEILKQLIKDKEIVIQIGHIERFNPALLSVEKYNLSPLFIESHRLSQYNPRGTDVSVIQDLMIHDIDLILNLVKSELTSIDASGVPLITKSIDIANARLKFKNGCVVNVTASRISQKKMRKMRIFQRNAYISLDFQENIAEVYLLKDLKEVSKIRLRKIKLPEISKAIIYEKPPIKHKNPMKIEQMKFFECILENKQPIVTIDDGIKAIKVAEEIIEKIKQSQNYILDT